MYWKQYSLFKPMLDKFPKNGMRKKCIEGRESKKLVYAVFNIIKYNTI